MSCDWLEDQRDLTGPEDVEKLEEPELAQTKLIGVTCKGETDRQYSMNMIGILGGPTPDP